MSTLFAIVVAVPLFILGGAALTLAGFAFLVWDNGPWPHYAEVEQ